MRGQIECSALSHCHVQSDSVAFAQERSPSDSTVELRIWQKSSDLVQFKFLV